MRVDPADPGAEAIASLAALRLSVTVTSPEPAVALLHAMPDLTLVASPNGSELIATDDVAARLVELTGLDLRAPAGDAERPLAAFAPSARSVAVTIAFQGVRRATVQEIAWIEEGGACWLVEPGERPAAAQPCSAADLGARILAALPA
jgi:hypothetical protein